MPSISDPNETSNPTEPNGDDETKTNQHPPRGPSRFALRDDGTLLVSLEDADERDVRGREIIPFMVLSVEEAALVRRAAEEALSAAASSTIGHLPKRAK